MADTLPCAESNTAIARIGKALSYDWAESMLADGDVSLSDIYETATKLQTVSEDIASYQADEDGYIPPTLKVPSSRSSNTSLAPIKNTVVFEEVKDSERKE